MHKLSNITPEIIILDKPMQWATGLMFKKKIEASSYLFVFPEERKVPLHMFFVFQAIDVLWVNGEHEVVDLKKNLLPFTPTKYHKGRAKYVVEMPAGTIEEHKIALMDVIDLT